MINTHILKPRLKKPANSNATTQKPPAIHWTAPLGDHTLIPECPRKKKQGDVEIPPHVETGNGKLSPQNENGDVEIPPPQDFGHDEIPPQDKNGNNDSPQEMAQTRKTTSRSPHSAPYAAVCMFDEIYNVNLFRKIN